MKDKVDHCSGNNLIAGLGQVFHLKAPLRIVCIGWATV